MAETPERWPLDQGDYERWQKLSVNHRALISDYVERVVHELRFAIYVAERLGPNLMPLKTLTSRDARRFNRSLP